MTEIELNEDQITAILTEGMARGLYECLNGALPDDPKVRSDDAQQLVQLAKNAFANGNRSDNVQTILFMAQVDQKPVVKKDPTIAPPGANNIGLTEEDVPTLDITNIHNGIDLSTLSDGVIEGLIVGLDKYPPSEQVEADRKAYLAEKERRNEKAGKSQDQSQGTTAQASAEKAGEAAPEDSPAASAAGTEAGTTGASEAGEGSPISDGDNSGEHSAEGAGNLAQGEEDAGAFARAQTPETSPEGKQAKAKPIEEDGKRLALEEQLTLPIVRAHGVDITKLNSIPVAQIEFMLENPDGPPKEEKDMAVSETEIVSSIVPKDEKSVAGVAEETPAEEKVITKADLGLEVDETTGEISADGLDRENLEAQLTGPTLKAYGQGRKNIPNIGINELKFMVDNPDGKVDPSELEAAKRKDHGEEVVKSSGLPVPDPLPEDAERVEDRTLTTAAFEAAAKLPSVKKLGDEEETAIKSPPVEEVNSSEVADIDNAEKANKVGNTRSSDKVFSEIDREEEQQQNRAMEIIFRENMPIPPDYGDENAPVLPVDVSQCSRDELFSYHARFHAYETRMNWILMQYEDELNDCIKLRSYREAVVAKSIPFMGEDGKRNTNEFREAQVRGDEEVLSLGEKEHEAKKIVSDLKVLQKIYHIDCERLSRQMSKYEIERSDAPR